jgi:HEAT repeat protein
MLTCSTTFKSRRVAERSLPTAVLAVLAKESKLLRKIFVLNSRDKSKEAYLARTTERVFEVLGPEAKDYIPELTQLMNDTNKTDTTAWWAIWGISFMGDNALPPLMNALANPPGRLRNMACIVIPHLGTNAYPAIPLLIDCLSDSNEIVVTDAELALGKLIVIPALTAKLSDPRPSVRRWGVEPLGYFGVEAKPAVPSLRKFLNDPDQWVRNVATNAIRAIAPEALTNTIKEVNP